MYLFHQLNLKYGSDCVAHARASARRVLEGWELHHAARWHNVPVEAVKDCIEVYESDAFAEYETSQWD